VKGSSGTPATAGALPPRNGPISLYSRALNNFGSTTGPAIVFSRDSSEFIFKLRREDGKTKMREKRPNSQRLFFKVASFIF
jgi:hypothetical protein